MREDRTRHRLQHLAREMSGGTDALGGVTQLAWLVFRERNQLLNGIQRRVAARDNGIAKSQREPDRRKCGRGVVGQILLEYLAF